MLGAPGGRGDRGTVDVDDGELDATRTELFYGKWSRRARADAGSLGRLRTARKMFSTMGAAP
jgi:hypothetical protein